MSIKNVCTRICDCRNECALGELTIDAHIEKCVSDRIQHILNDKDLSRIFEKYGGEVFRRSSVFHGLGKFLRQLNVRGRVAFEVGTWNGLCAILFSRRFDKVVSVDVAHNPLKYEIADYLGIRNITFVDLKDNAEKYDIAKELDFDFAYLDGNHERDTWNDYKATQKCGRILFHENWRQQMPVWNLVQSLPRDEVTLGGINLALWQKKK